MAYKRSRAVGTAEPGARTNKISAVPMGRASIIARIPGVETPGYFRASLRDALPACPLIERIIIVTRRWFAGESARATQSRRASFGWTAEGGCPHMGHAGAFGAYDTYFFVH